jgi:hypothetical protein
MPRRGIYSDAPGARGACAGDIVKARFDIGGNVERMWIVVTDETEAGYVGTLANESSYGRGRFLRHGTRIEFGPEHVIAIQDAEMRRQHHESAAIQIKKSRPDMTAEEALAMAEVEVTPLTAGLASDPMTT